MNYVFPFSRRRNRMGLGNENDMGCVDVEWTMCVQFHVDSWTSVCSVCNQRFGGGDITFLQQKMKSLHLLMSLTLSLVHFSLWPMSYCRICKLNSNRIFCFSIKFNRKTDSNQRHCIQSIDVMLWWPMKLILFSISNYDSCNSSSEWNDTFRNDDSGWHALECIGWNFIASQTERAVNAGAGFDLILLIAPHNANYILCASMRMYDRSPLRRCCRQYILCTTLHC